MNLANAIEGGVTGAATLSLLEQALTKVDSRPPKGKLLNKPGIIKKLKKASKKKNSPKLYIRLASELLTTAGYFGLTALGKKKNAMLRGAVLGAAAGLGVAFLSDNDKHQDMTENEILRDKILTVALYTVGGVLAGAAIKKINKKMGKR